MSEPTPAPPAPPVETLSPEAAAAEIGQIRGNPDHDMHHAGRPGAEAAFERFLRLSARAYGGDVPAAAPAALTDEGSPSPAPPSVFNDPAEGPRTAADLDASPAPEFSDAAKARGWAYDSAELKQFHALAEQEDMVELAAEGERLMVRVADDPVPVYDATVRALKQEWGPRWKDNLAVSRDGYNWYKSKRPTDAAAIEKDGYENRLQVILYFYRVGQRRWDPATPGGVRRLKAKYSPKDGA